MKRTYLLVAILLAVSTQLIGQSNDDKAIRQVLSAFKAAIKNNNADAANEILTDNFLMTPASGVQRLNKSQRLESIKSGQFKYDSFKDENVKVSIRGNAAYLVIKTIVKFNIDGKEYRVDSVNLFFEKKDKNWLLADECYLGRNCYR